MTVSTEDAAVRVPQRADKERSGRELAVAAVFGPLADVLALALLRLRIRPTAVVLASGAAGLAAAALLGASSLLAAAMLLQLKTLLDNADGRLARASGSTTLVGRYLDTEADLVVNAALFGALGAITGQPWLALAGFCALTLVLSVDFNAERLYREARDDLPELPRPTGSRSESVLERIYAIVFAPQDRLVHAVSTGRLDRILAREPDPGRTLRATLAYHDRPTVTVLANLGLSTQLAVLGACLVLEAPSVYLWLVLGCAALLPVLQVRRELIARKALRG
jgi:phosphatidylglycerophosphate synthase